MLLAYIQYLILQPISADTDNVLIIGFWRVFKTATESFQLALSFCFTRPDVTGRD